MGNVATGLGAEKQGRIRKKKKKPRPVVDLPDHAITSGGEGGGSPGGGGEVGAL